MRRDRLSIQALCLAFLLNAGAAAQAGNGPLSITASYKSDTVAIVDGGVARGARWLDNLNVIANVDLEGLAGWKGARFHGDLLNNLGGRPNDLTGSIQGINNIEVAHARFKLFEAWIEQDLGRHVSLRAGLYDLNTEFYQTDASSLMIASTFGIGAELSATGPNGPSIFPLTTLAARVEARVGKAYARVAIVNAEAGPIGERSVPLVGRDGALLIGEAGWRGEGRGKVALGLWRYSRRQPLMYKPALAADHISQGAYMVAEREILSLPRGSHVRGFLRLGLSDGHSTPYDGGWQAGLLLDHLFADRPESRLSVGAGVAYLSRGYREQQAAAGMMPEAAETILELTYQDEILPGVKLQPDIQYVIHPAGNPAIDDALVLGLRLQLDFDIR